MGYTITLSFIGLSTVSCIAYFLFITRENHKRNAMAKTDRALTWEEKQEMGDLNPDYRYQL